MLMIFKCGHFLLPTLTGTARGGDVTAIVMCGENPDQRGEALLWIVLEPGTTVAEMAY